MNPKEFAANMLAEVKLAERKLAKLEERQGQLENAIRSALRASDRAQAEKLAVEFERVKQEVTQKKAFVAEARTQFEAAKRRSKQIDRGMKSARTLDATAKAMEGINKSMDTLTDADDVLRKIEAEVALSEAKLEIASDEAASKADRVIDLAPEIAANEILAEFEQADAAAAKPAAAKPAPEAAPSSLGPEGQPPKKTIGGADEEPTGRTPDEILEDFK